MTSKRSRLALTGAVIFVTGFITTAAAAQDDPGTSTETPAATPKPASEPNCLDFASQQEAQDFFVSQGGPDNDPYGLDSNDNGVACDAVVVAVLSESGTLLPQEATPDPNAPGPPGASTSTTSPVPTTAPSAPTTTIPSVATPTPSTLPRSGGRIQTYGMSGATLVLIGLALMLLARTRQRPARYDEYSLIGW